MNDKGLAKDASPEISCLIKQIYSYMTEPKEALNTWIDEYQKGVRYGLEGKILINEKSPFQQITLIERLIPSSLFILL